MQDEYEPKLIHFNKSLSQAVSSEKLMRLHNFQSITYPLLSIYNVYLN